MSRQIALKYVLPFAAVALLILLAAWAFRLPPVAALTGQDTPAATTNATSPPGQAVGYPYDVIQVSGTGTVTEKPDLAMLSLGVSVTAPTVAEARTQAAESMQAVDTALSEAGIADIDIQTSHFRVNADYDWRTDPPTLQGYEVSNGVNVTVRDIDNVGAVIDAAIEAGGNDIEFNGLRFDFTDATRADMMKKAREFAVADMQRKALQLARASHRQRGNLKVISEIGDVAAPIAEVAGLARAFADAPTPISVGESSVAVTVYGVYELR